MILAPRYKMLKLLRASLAQFSLQKCYVFQLLGDLSSRPSYPPILDPSRYSKTRLALPCLSLCVSYKLYSCLR